LWTGTSAGKQVTHMDDSQNLTIVPSTFIVDPENETKKRGM
jgi:hypothetical protein